MSKYELTLRCKAFGCNHRYKRVVEVLEFESIDDVPNPPCPKCAKKPKRVDASETSQASIPIRPIEEWLDEQRAPGITGANVLVKAIDKTAEVVMHDHKLTDLKDNIRVGDTMAPRLPPAQQKAADNFFSGGAPGKKANSRQQAKMSQMLRRAVGGSYRAGALDVKSVLPDQRVALRKVGVEPINK